MILDRAHFDHMTGGDVALQAEVLGLFRAQAAGWTQTLASNDNWRDAAHTIKGSARGIGFWALAEACAAAESAEEQGLAAALARVHAALAEALRAADEAPA